MHSSGLGSGLNMMQLLKKRHISFVAGVCCQPVSLPCHSMPQFQSPHVKIKRFCGVKMVILSKFCLLIDLWTRTLDCWSRNSSSWELDDKNTMEFLTFVLQTPICWKILSRRKWVMCLIYYLASATPFSGCRKVLFLLPLELPKSEDCGEKMYPKGQFPFFPCITRLKSFTSQPYTSTVQPIIHFKLWAQQNSWNYTTPYDWQIHCNAPITLRHNRFFSLEVCQIFQYLGELRGGLYSEWQGEPTHINELPFSVRHTLQLGVKVGENTNTWTHTHACSICRGFETANGVQLWRLQSSADCIPENSVEISSALSWGKGFLRKSRKELLLD